MSLVPVSTLPVTDSVFFFGVRIWLVLGQFSLNYFRGLGLRVRVWVGVRVSNLGLVL